MGKDMQRLPTVSVESLPMSEDGDGGGCGLHGGCSGPVVRRQDVRIVF